MMIDWLSASTLIIAGISTVLNAIMVMKRIKASKKENSEISKVLKRINSANSDLKYANELMLSIIQKEGEINFNTEQKDEMNKLGRELDSNIKEYKIVENKANCQ